MMLVRLGARQGVQFYPYIRIFWDLRIIIVLFIISLVSDGLVVDRYLSQLASLENRFALISHLGILPSSI